MSRVFSRRRMIAAGGAAVVTPLALHARSSAVEPLLTGPLITLRTPARMFDSRTAHPSIGGGKLVSGNSVAVTVIPPPEEVRFLLAAFLNVTITETEGSGFLRVSASDLSGEAPVPMTSNVNWSGPNQTLANLVLTEIGGESAVAVFAGGGGRTHFVVDLQGYVPFTG